MINLNDYINTCCLTLTFFQTFSNIVAHPEFRLPRYDIKIIGMIFIKNNLYHVHHLYQLPFAGCNCGDVLSSLDILKVPFQKPVLK